MKQLDILHCFKDPFILVYACNDTFDIVKMLCNIKIILIFDFIMIKSILHFLVNTQ